MFEKIKKSKYIAILLSMSIALCQPLSVYPSEDNLEEMIQQETEQVSTESVAEVTETELMTDEPNTESETECATTERITETLETTMETENQTVLEWSGTGYKEQNTIIELSYEDGGFFKQEDALMIKPITNQIVSYEWGFFIEKQIQDNKAYIIKIKNPDIGDLKNTSLYHQKESGELEKISFLYYEEKEDIYIEFLTLNGLGDFLFVTDNIPETSTNDVESTEENIVSEPGSSGLTSQAGLNPSSQSGNESGEAGELSTETDSENQLNNLKDIRIPHSENLSSPSQDVDREPETQANELQTDEQSKVDLRLQPNDKNTEQPSSSSTTDDLLNLDSPSPDKNESKGNDLQLSSDNVETEQSSQASLDETKQNCMSEEQQTSDIDPVVIDEFHISFVNGAERENEKNVWAPSDPAAGHAFIYRVDYTMSGAFSTDIGAFKIELPLHILKDKSGNWADTFSCPYRLRADADKDEKKPDFVYEIDETKNKVVIYNYKPYPTGEAGYIEFAYETTKTTMEYMDMCASTKVNAKVYATNINATVTAEAEAEEIYIDTHATIAYTKKKQPALYYEWDNTWGTKPEDADQYLYLIWPVFSYINKNTSAYNFYLNDTFHEANGTVVGYRFAGQTQFSETNHIDNLISYGDRYDYVLTKYSKEIADKMLEESRGYTLHNDVEAKVSPIDHIDEETSATSSCDWYYKAPVYTGSKGDFWAEKYGVYGNYGVVYDTEDISNYMLGEFEDGEIETLPNLKYYVIANGYPYPYTLSDEADGTINDALNGLYGKKNVNYCLIDDGISIENTALNDDDYDIAGIEINHLIRDAVFNSTTYEFQQTGVTDYKTEDNFSLYVRTGSIWEEAAVYNVKTKTYEKINERYIKESNGRKLSFTAGIKGVKCICSNAYYYTKLILYPEISLYRTSHVLSILKNATAKISVTNAAYFHVTQGDKKIFERATQGTDYVQKVKRESEIKKDIIKTKNIKQESRFEILWNINAKETYVDNSGVHYIYQNSGIFYDLLPAGCNLDISSLIVKESEKTLTNGEYDYEVIENYKNTGRMLLKINMITPTKNEYSLQYITSHDYSAITDYGKNLLNSTVYESGNARIGNGFPDNGGDITDKNILKDIDPDTDAEKFIYAEARYEVNFPVAAVTGLKKMIKSSSSTTYSYNEKVHKNEKYSYQIRLTNDSTTKAKDLIFFDSLENFYQDSGQTEPTVTSDWKGELIGIDVAQFIYKGAKPIIYLSKENINPQDHHDLQERSMNGNQIWIEHEKFKELYGLNEAKAIAVDARNCNDGSDFILDEKDSVSFTIYMKAPEKDNSKKKDPVAYNNIFVSRTAIKEIGEEVIEIPQFFHQDYTQAHYRITGDVSCKKIDATDVTNTIQGVSYQLTGISDYGTSYHETRTSNQAGEIIFTDIEKGKYELKEIYCSEDWQIDNETYIVFITETGETSIPALSQEKDIYYLMDKPRIHANVLFEKKDSVTNSPINGATFKLSGTSDYGTEYCLYAESNIIGRVAFNDIELGTYELKEVKTPEGYIKSNDVYAIEIDERGKVTFYSKNEEMTKNTQNYYQITNEPYHSIRFLKSSTYGNDIYLEDAEFSLIGISDYGTNVNMTAISGKAEDGGIVVFQFLEPGTYTLKETKAPDGYYVDPKSYSVVVQKSGAFEIKGLSKQVVGPTTRQ